MILAFCDIETTELPKADTFHCGVVRRDGKSVTYYNPQALVNSNKDVDKWVFHNGLNFDCPKINEFVGYKAIDPKDVIDTMVVSKLVDFSKFRTHSLKEIGEYLKVHKGDYTGGFDKLTKEMVEYCEQDVVVLEAIFNYLKPYVMDPAWSQAMRLEHDMATLSYGMQQNGFKFKVEEAKGLLSKVTDEMSTLEAGFSKAFPPELVPNRTIKMRKRKDGKLYPNVLRAMAESPKVEISDDGTELVIFEYKEFNPGSPKQRVDKLWEAGWKPLTKTKGHKKFLQDQRRKHYD